MKTTIPFEIVKYLDGKDYTFAGAIENHIRGLSGGMKWETTGRRLRELSSEKWCREHLNKPAQLDKEMRQINGAGRKYVCYKIKLPTNPKDLREYYKSVDRLKVEIVKNEKGETVAREVLLPADWGKVNGEVF